MYEILIAEFLFGLVLIALSPIAGLVFAVGLIAYNVWGK